jgi:phosphocarrier protein HPr
MSEALPVAEVTRRAIICNELGLHARAASKLVQLAASFPVELHIGREEMMVNAKSIMGVLMLAAARGTELLIVARGDDEERCEGAVSALAALIDDRFGEKQ